MKCGSRLRPRRAAPAPLRPSGAASPPIAIRRRRARDYAAAPRSEVSRRLRARLLRQARAAEPHLQAEPVADIPLEGGASQRGLVAAACRASESCCRISAWPACA